MSKSYYIMLSGLPASGKSTLREELQKKWPLVIKPVVISSDDFIEDFAKGCGLTYTEVFPKIIAEAAFQTKENFRKAISEKRHIIHDMTHLSVKSRKRNLDLLNDDYLKICIYTCVDEEERQKRMLQRTEKFIPPEIDQNMRNSWEVPRRYEGFDYIFSHTDYCVFLDQIKS